MPRYFEKISEKEFSKVFNGTKASYEDITLPVRKTVNSAGYDFFMPYDLVLKTNEIAKVPTGIKACMNSNEFLGIYVRSSMGFKYNLRMCNQVGIIDADYYNNENNEGHIFIAIQNHGDKEITLNKNDAFVQGIFQSYNITDNDIVENERSGGLGSTSKKEGNENE